MYIDQPPLLSLKRGEHLLWEPVLVQVGKLFAIGQVVAEIVDHWLSEPA
jgi:hypothetical protein